MTKACYVGVAGKARKVKKIYTGVADKARKVKKAYVGVGGKARLFYSADQKLGYYGTVTGLSQVKSSLVATAVGNYALFGGGVGADSAYFATVDAYSGALVRSTPTSLSQVRSGLVTTAVGNYALFGGGSVLDSSFNFTYFATVDAYSGALVRSTPTSLSRARGRLAATAVGNYALFGGGSDGFSSSSYLATVDAYSGALVRSTPRSLSQARGDLAATAVGNYALFGGGVVAGSAFFATVDAYNLV